MPTTSKAWKHTVEITLPSGYTVELRPLGYDLILKCDQVPDVITSLVVKAFKGQEVSPDITEFKQAGEYAAFLATCCQLCFVHPQVVERPEGEDQISADMIEFDDQAFVFSLLGKSRRWLEIFRDQQAQNLSSGANGADGSPAAEQAAEAEEAAAT